VELIIERRDGQPDRVIHVVGGGLRRCGVMVEFVAVTS
jgi:tryptophan synthase beta subunit